MKKRNKIIILKAQLLESNQQLKVTEAKLVATQAELAAAKALPVNPQPK
jgi:hypothetical protein